MDRKANRTEKNGGAEMKSFNLKYEFIAIILIFRKDLKFICAVYMIPHVLPYYSNRNVFSLDFRFGNLFGQMMIRLSATGFDLPRFTWISCARTRSQEFHKCNNLTAISKFNGVRRCSCMTVSKNFDSKSEAHI